MKLFGSTKKLIDRAKITEYLPSRDVIKVVLVQCNFVDNQYQQKSEEFHAQYIFCLYAKCWTKQFNISKNL